MSLRRKLRQLFRVRTTPIYVGHRYRDEVTGESLTVASVGPQVLVEPGDTNRRRDTWSVPKQTMRTAIEDGVIVHDKMRCQKCDDVPQR